MGGYSLIQIAVGVVILAGLAALIWIGMKKLRK
jgi:hypothetical protein